LWVWLFYSVGDPFYIQYVYGVRYDVTAFICTWIQLCQNHLLEWLFFSPVNGIGTLVENQLAIDIWIYFWIHNSISSIFMSVLLPIPHCLITIVL
jgi:hypothetical protein